MKSLLPKFTRWLEANHDFTSITIRAVELKANYYVQWLKKIALPIKKATYKDILNYIEYLQEKEQKSKTIINEHLVAIGHFYDFLQLPNVAYNVRVKGVQRKLPLLLDEEELNYLYANYKDRVSLGYYRYSNKILLGLFIYQAVDVQDLRGLELKDVDLEKGTMYLPAGVKRKNSRIVKLEVHQIIALHKYINEYRNKDITKDHIGTTDLLFSPQAETRNRLNRQCESINRSLRKHVNLNGINYIDLPQLRKSRIAIWIKQYGTRQAQYLSGRKCISSIEQYQKIDVGDLSKKINELHPIGKS